MSKKQEPPRKYPVHIRHDSSFTTNAQWLQGSMVAPRFTGTSGENLFSSVLPGELRGTSSPR
ncbi:MAG TPA: hypothetical protein VFW71_02580 [Actinomycetota bacterium]|nr:hypothetical protein [Actinomycetota bacterium]